MKRHQIPAIQDDDFGMLGPPKEYIYIYMYTYIIIYCIYIYNINLDDLYRLYSHCLFLFSPYVRCLSTP